MAGYAAMTRVQGGRVRALAWAVERDLGERSGAPPELEAEPAIVAMGQLEPTLGERWTWFREELAMMTFFLLDAESWR